MLRKLDKIYAFKKSALMENLSSFRTLSSPISTLDDPILYYKDGKSGKPEKNDLTFTKQERTIVTKTNVYLLFHTQTLAYKLMEAVDNDQTRVYEVLLALNTQVSLKDSTSKTLIPVESTYNSNYLLELFTNTKKLALKAEHTLEDSYKIYIQRSLEFLESTDLRFIKTALKKTFELIGLGVFYEQGQDFVTIAHPASKVRIELSNFITIKSLQNLIIDYWSEEISKEELFEIKIAGGVDKPMVD